MYPTADGSHDDCESGHAKTKKHSLTLHDSFKERENRRNLDVAACFDLVRSGALKIKNVIAPINN